MNRDILPFTLNLIFRDWGIIPVALAGVGLGASILGHVGSDVWKLRDTLTLTGAMLLVAIIAKSVSFAYAQYRRGSPRIAAVRFVEGDGLNVGNTILVFSFAQGFEKGQLLTVFCESSGARQPILLAEITAVYETEIQAVPVGDVKTHDLRKYFEEESRRRMLFATPEVSSQHIVTFTLGGA